MAKTRMYEDVQTWNPFKGCLFDCSYRKPSFQLQAKRQKHNCLPSYLKPYVSFAYKVGWRDSEISGLTWNKVDLDQRTVRLEAGETKNKSGRLIYLDDELLEMFRQQYDARKRSGKLCPYVFPNESGTGPIKDFRGTWNKACRDTGLGYGYKTSAEYVAEWKDKLAAGPILHDFRRTAVRNMVRSGVPERVAMMISGHKTRSVFDRYNIVSEADLKLAAEKQEAYLNSSMGTILGTIHDLGTKEGVSRNG